MSLQHTGPWSSTVISEENLFGFNAGPYTMHQWRQVTVSLSRYELCRRR